MLHKGPAKQPDSLQESQELYRLMVEGVRDYAIFMLDPSGKVATWNVGAERNKGYSASDIIGRHFSAFYPQEDIDNGKPEMELRVASQVGRFEDEGWRLRKDGSRFWANVIITAMRDRDGRLVGFSKVTRDLTERKQAEARLQEANESLEKRVKERTEELEKAVRARDEFLSVASHELKTPLTSLKLQAQLRKRMVMREDFAGFSAERFRRLIEDDERQINRLQRLVDDMLDIARLRSGRLELRPEPADLVQLLKDVAERLRPQFEAAGCAMTEELPAALTGEWDTYRLEQVVINLFTNAMKYGAGRPIRVEAGRSGDRVWFAVSDQGIGIAPEDHERIFEQFERAVSASEVSGLGLGLYIVRQILETHQGTIRVESARDHGSRFIVELPIKSS